MYDTILVPTDGSDCALAAAERAIDLAETYGATVHALYVVDVRMSPVSGVDREEVLELFEASDHDPTGPVAERAEAAGVPAVEHVVVGVPHERIREYVRENDVDLVVMGTHGRTGLDHALLGSVAGRVVRTAGVPVLTVPEDGPERPAGGQASRSR